MASLLQGVCLLQALLLCVSAQTTNRYGYRTTDRGGNNLGRVNELVQASGCGILKGCFRDPAGCQPADRCSSLASWRRSGDDLEVQVTGSTSSNEYYVALGLSNDRQHRDSYQVYCMRTRFSSPELKLAYIRPDQSITFLSTSDRDRIIRNIVTRLEGNNIACECQVLGNVNIIDRPLRFDQPYFLILTKGTARDGAVTGTSNQVITQERQTLNPPYSADKGSQLSGYLFLSLSAALLAFLWM